MKYPTLETLTPAQKTVFVRVDYNVTLDDAGKIRDDTRLVESLPTLNFLLNAGAKLVLASHLGRPDGQVNPKYSLLPVAQRLAELLNRDVLFPDDCVGLAVAKLIRDAKAGQVILLENLRFHAEEEANDVAFAEQLAHLADIYVTDAFGTLHRAHASTVGMVKFFKEKAIGRLVEKECQFLGRLLQEPESPFVVVLGGAKVSDKIGVIENLLNVADQILIGGGMAYTFLQALGVDVGQSLVEDGKVALAKRLWERAKNKNVEMILPLDSVVADAFAKDARHSVKTNADDWGAGRGLDIGPVTAKRFATEIAKAKTVFWNGPMGVYEFPAFQAGTKAVAQAIAETKCLSVVGGGDSLAAVEQTGFADRITHLSTGGGAALTFLEGVELPGLKIFG